LTPHLAMSAFLKKNIEIGVPLLDSVRSDTYLETFGHRRRRFFM